MAEKKLYPHLERFLRSTFGCFRTAQRHRLGIAGVTGEIDVVGLRHVGGDLAGDVEVIAVEVKDDEPFLKSAGQTLGYGVMAHRCYLAAVETFTRHQRDVAAHLGIGLISISRGKHVRCKEIQSAPRHEPVKLMTLELVEKMGYAPCSLCGSHFQISKRKDRLTESKYVLREGQDSHRLQTASEREVGYVFWPTDVDAQRTDARAKSRDPDSYFDRRYLCPSCVVLLAAEE